MKKLFLKIGLYAVLILIMLELIVRALHLHSDSPKRMIDDRGVEKNIPLQTGFNVTGNRKQNAKQYHINAKGFNSINDKVGSKATYDIALIGDSYIEGFHEDTHNSIGRMVERNLDTVNVIEYGCSGYDMADQLHLVKAYEKEFQQIDKIIFYLKFENDLERSVYEPNYQRLAKLNSLYYKIKNGSKLLVYAANLGLLANFSGFVKENLRFNDSSQNTDFEKTTSNTTGTDKKRINNFKSLIAHHGFDTERFVLLLDTRVTSKNFINFCTENKIVFIDFADSFTNTDAATDYGYDMHWNTYGRELIAKKISKHLLKPHSE